MNLQWVIFLKVMWEEAEIERVAVIKKTERDLNAATFKTRSVKGVCVRECVCIVSQHKG